MIKKWVFDELVEHPEEDVIGLIAYAVYKSAKADCAKGTRESGASEQEVEAAVFSFHESVVNSKSQLEGYRKQARVIVDEFSKAISNELREEYQKELDSILSDQKNEVDVLLKRQVEEREKHSQNLAEEREKAVCEFISKVKNSPEEKAWVRGVKWQWNGFSGVFAAVISTIVVGGLLYLTVPAEERVRWFQGYITNWAVGSSSDDITKE